MRLLVRSVGKQLAVGTASAVVTFALLAQASSAFAALTGDEPPLLGPEAQRVVELTNDLRRERGCDPLRIDAHLTAAAQAHSDDMATHDYFSHTGRRGSHAGDRITAAKYPWRAWAENIAAGYDTPDAVVGAWMDSDGHRANILNCELRDIGVGYAENRTSTYGTYWTQNFGTRR